MLYINQLIETDLQIHYNYLLKYLVVVVLIMEFFAIFGFFPEKLQKHIGAA
jgi:hypothetical protein